MDEFRPVKDVVPLLTVGTEVEYDEGGVFRGVIGEIGPSNFFIWQDVPGRGGSCGCLDPHSLGFGQSWSVSKSDSWNLIRIVSSTKTTSMAKLTEKFALVFKKEPEKSFIKAGIMDTNEMLTTDGQAVFLAFLLKENGEKFKKDVVDPILAADAEDKE